MSLPSFYIRWTTPLTIFIFLVLQTCLAGCSGKASPDPGDPAEQLQAEIERLLSATSIQQNGLDDSTHLPSAIATLDYYKDRDWTGIWVKRDSLTPLADSMLQLVRNARRYGLFPTAYHLASFDRLQYDWAADTLTVGARKDFRTWARLDILLTDAFLTMARQVHRGHVPVDSLEKDEAYSPATYVEALTQAIASNDPATQLARLEPTTRGYRELKAALPGFLERADFSKTFTYIEYPFRDSLEFIRSLLTRLQEENYIDTAVTTIDSASLSTLLKNVQAARQLKVDGKYGPQLIGSLNNYDAEKFMKAAINMDRYRLQPDTLPERYLLVNLPAFTLQIIDADTIALESNVIIGKKKTPTPLLQSQMGQIIVYPTWTIPASIIADEILPAVKRDPGYLARKGYNLYDQQGNEVDPYSVDWSKYKKGIPYKVVQGEGIGNALGIMKFNFPNEHFVYLHDTNQRSLFRNENRSLSHGCVRVQNWEGLYQYLIRSDSILALKNNSSFTPIDSVRAWLKQEKRRVIPLKDRLPIFFRYHTAAGRKGKLETYQDVYGMDTPIRNGIEGKQ